MPPADLLQGITLPLEAWCQDLQSKPYSQTPVNRNKPVTSDEKVLKNDFPVQHETCSVFKVQL